MTAVITSQANSLPDKGTGNLLQVVFRLTFKPVLVRGVITTTERTTRFTGDEVVCHFEEDPVLLADVGLDEIDEVRRICAQQRLGIFLARPCPGHCFFHSPDIDPALLVLTEHYRNRTGISGHPVLDELGEEQILFFAVVTEIGIETEERDATIHDVKVRLEIGVGQLPIQHVDHAKDQLMLIAEHSGCRV